MKGYGSIIRLMVNKLGEKLSVKSKTETIDSYGRKRVDWSDEFYVWGLVSQLTGLTENFERFGMYVETDYLVTMNKEYGELVKAGDLIKIWGSWCEVREKTIRKWKGTEESYEFVCRRRFDL